MLQSNFSYLMPFGTINGFIWNLHGKGFKQTNQSYGLKLRFTPPTIQKTSERETLRVGASFLGLVWEASLC